MTMRANPKILGLESFMGVKERKSDDHLQAEPLGGNSTQELVPCRFTMKGRKEGAFQILGCRNEESNDDDLECFGKAASQ
jgi:hypothetical protein